MVGDDGHVNLRRHHRRRPLPPPHHPLRPP